MDAVLPRRRVPFIAQMEAVECGAASLAMVLAYFGHHAPLSELRQACGVSRDGSNAKNIVVAARRYGLKTRGRRLEPSDLASVEVPAILHWEMNHFLVLERYTPSEVFLVDPASGRRRVAASDFDKSFTGICLELSPGETFTPRARAPVSRQRYIDLLRAAGRALGMVLFASLALNVLSLTLPIATAVTIDDVLGRARFDWLGLVAACGAALVTFNAAYALLRGWLLVRVQRALDEQITSSFVEHLLDLPVPFFAQRPAADLMARVLSNRTLRDVLAGQSVALLAGGVTLVAYLALMVAFDPGLTVWVVAAAVAYGLVYSVARPVLLAANDDALRKDVAASSARLQILRGIATIKSSGVERVSHARWLNAWIESLGAQSRVALRRELVTSILFAIRAAVPIIVLWVGARRVLAGDLTAGRLIAFQMLQAGFLGPLEHIAQTLVRLQILPALLERMDDVLLSAREPAGGTVSPRLEGSITLEDVSFRYGDTSPMVLSNISLAIHKGQKVAFVGPSGSGKSTLARLLLGLYTPTEGRIRFDEHDLSTLDVTSVRRQIGVVLQETALFDGTIADNLRLFYPNLPLDRLAQAARVAQIHEDIQALPRGYETRISASGGIFSGGQRQRLALARAIVHHPSLMILDEATSALDAVTEAAIERYLSTRACTRLVIAHRLSTVRDADLICVMEGGRIVEQGRHDDLLAAGGLYARLATGAERPVATTASPRAPITGEELRAFHPFQAWTDVDRDRLAAELVRLDLPEGARVVEQDARATGLFLIAEGEVRVELAQPGLEAWTVAELGPGAIVGEIGLLDGSPSSASVVAKTAIRLLHLPYPRFRELAQRGEVLGVRASLALGALVAERTRDAIRRRGEIAEAVDDEVASPSPRGRRQELRLEETRLGAALSPAEVELLHAIGRRAVVAAGEVITRQGADAPTMHVLLAGRAVIRHHDAVLAVVEAGGMLGEITVFDAATLATSATAIDECVLFTLPRERLLDLLTSGEQAAHRLLSPLAEGLVRQFRLANHRLREAVALAEGELDRAHAAREEAMAAAREEREALVAQGGGRVPIVRAARPEDAGAACLTALLRAWGRPVSLASVAEWFAGAPAGVVEATMAVARTLRLSCRRLDLRSNELAFASERMIALLEDERLVVVEPRPFGRFRIMDPVRGESAVMKRAELARVFSGVALEVRDDAATPAGASLPARAWWFARSRARAIGRLAAVTLVLQGLGMASALATAAVVGKVFPFADGGLLVAIVAAVAAIAVASAAFQQLQARAIEHLRAHFDRELTDQLMTHVLELPIAFFDRYPAGEILQRFQAFENVRLLFSTQGISAILSVASLAASCVLLVAFAPSLAAIAAAVAVVHFVCAAMVFPWLRRAAAVEVAARARTQDRLLEVLQGMVTLRMSGDRSAAHQRWLPPFLEELAATTRQERVTAFALPALEWTRNLAAVACVVRGARAVMAGSMSLATYVAFLGVLAMFFASTSSLVTQLLTSARSLVDYDLVRTTFAEPREQASRSHVAPGDLRGRIEVEGVSFRYTPDGPNVLEDVSLAIESGTKVALVGASGSGKSTLGKLLLGLYLPSAGRILFDGKDVASMDLEGLRRRMGVVLQEPFLLSGTIRENIALGAENVPFERIVDAAEAAALREDVEKMPMRFDTLVSEGGTAFSGGQRQRCVIARALVARPAVLLLDEATSALDNLSQAVIEQHVATSTATRIVVAHRLSTVVDADQILVLDKGAIVERGTHTELVAARGRYYELIQAQLGAGE